MTLAPRGARAHRRVMTSEEKPRSAPAEGTDAKGARTPSATPDERDDERRLEESVREPQRGGGGDGSRGTSASSPEEIRGEGVEQHVPPDAPRE